MSHNNLSTSEKILKGDTGVASVLAWEDLYPASHRPSSPLPKADLTLQRFRGDSQERNEVFGCVLLPGVGVGRGHFSQDVFM